MSTLSQRWRGPAAMALIAMALAVATPTSAEAQLGWIKRLLGKKPPAPAQVAVPQAGAGAAAPSSDQGGSSSAPSPVAPPTLLPQASGSSPTPDPAVQAAVVAQREEYERRLAYGKALDERPVTLQSVQERLQFWEGMKLTPPFNPEVHQAFDRARRDLETLQREDSSKRASDARLADVDKKLDVATRSLRTNSFSDVVSITDDILASDPGNEKARRLKVAAENGEKLRRLKITLFALGAAAIALFVVLSVFAKKIFRKESGGDPSTTPVGATANGRRVYVKVVDGVGRGKLVPVPGDVFRIGAMESADDADRNDLVLSDSLAAISRHHCDIIRKGRDYFLVDSSRNGTRLNDRILARGDERRLRDGDEFSLADVSRLKFVKT